MTYLTSLEFVMFSALAPRFQESINFWDIVPDLEKLPERGRSVTLQAADEVRISGAQPIIVIVRKMDAEFRKPG